MCSANTRTCTFFSKKIKKQILLAENSLKNQKWTCAYTSAHKKWSTHAPSPKFFKIFPHPIAQKLPQLHLCGHAHWSFVFSVRTHTKVLFLRYFVLSLQVKKLRLNSKSNGHQKILYPIMSYEELLVRHALSSENWDKNSISEIWMFHFSPHKLAWRL